MSATIQINGAIEFKFSVTDWELARQIDALLTKNARSIAKSVAPPKSGNGRVTRKDSGSPETKDQILKLLKEKYGTKTFSMAEATPLIESKLGVKATTIRRALKMGKDAGMLQGTRKGVYSFLLESALTPLPAIGSAKSSVVTPLPAST